MIKPKTAGTVAEGRRVTYFTTGQSSVNLIYVKTTVYTHC